MNGLPLTKQSGPGFPCTTVRVEKSVQSCNSKGGKGTRVFGWQALLGICCVAVRLCCAHGLRAAVLRPLLMCCAAVLHPCYVCCVAVCRCAAAGNRCCYRARRCFQLHVPPGWTQAWRGTPTTAADTCDTTAPHPPRAHSPQLRPAWQAQTQGVCYITPHTAPLRPSELWDAAAERLQK